jgi:carbamate kinase
VLAEGLGADLLVIATDVDAVYLDWGTPANRAITAAHPDALGELDFAAGSMGPKVEAAAAFARSTARPAVIGSLDQLSAILAGKGGTRVGVDVTGVQTT